MTTSLMTNGDQPPKRRSKRSHTRVSMLNPVWFFSDDLKRLDGILSQLGKTEISTDRALHPDCDEVLDRLPVALLCVSIQENGTTVMIRPDQVEVRWCFEWDPSALEEDVIRQVQSFIASRRHVLFWLGEREWQLAIALVAIISVLPMASSYLLRGEANDPAKLLAAALGTPFGLITLALAIAGFFIPSRSRVTLWARTRRQFWRGVRRIARYVGGGTALFFLGILLGSRTAVGVRPLSVSLLALAILAALVYAYSSWTIQRK